MDSPLEPSKGATSAQRATQGSPKKNLCLQPPWKISALSTSHLKLNLDILFNENRLISWNLFQTQNNCFLLWQFIDFLLGISRLEHQQIQFSLLWELPKKFNVNKCHELTKINWNLVTMAFLTSFLSQNVCYFCQFHKTFIIETMKIEAERPKNFSF